MPGNRLFYLAIPPSMIGAVVKNLGEAGSSTRCDGGPWSRVIVEKPFGRDLATARALNEELAQVFRERQIFRIDHYLGKETTQNILVFRLGNGIFEPLWNRRYVDHVQITVAESIGVENRGPVLRGVGRPARHHPEPRPAAPLPRRDGAARRLRPERRARREGEGPEVHPAADARGDHARHGARPVRPGRGRRRRRSSATGREGRQPDVPARDVRGLEGADRELALGGRPVLPPRRASGSPSASRRSRSSSRRRPSRSSGRWASCGRSRTPSSCASSPTRASRLKFGAKEPGPRHEGRPRHDGLPLRASSSGRRSPRRTSASSSTRCTATPRSSRAATRSRPRGST